MPNRGPSPDRIDQYRERLGVFLLRKQLQATRLMIGGDSSFEPQHAAGRQLLLGTTITTPVNEPDRGWPKFDDAYRTVHDRGGIPGAEGLRLPRPQRFDPNLVSGRLVCLAAISIRRGSGFLADRTRRLEALQHPAANGHPGRDQRPLPRPNRHL